MKLNVAENAKRNMLWGIILNFYQILVPFILRSLFIRRLGIEYVGLGGLFSSLLNFLSLAEIGVGSTVLYFLYRPVAENDEKTIRQLLGLIKDTYRKIGLLIFGLGLALTPFLRLLISEEPPVGINIFDIYLLSLLQTVLPYWLFPGKSLVFSVHQRNDISSRVALVTSTVRYILQLIILTCFPNYYVYLITAILTQLMSLVLLAFLADHEYPEYRTTLPAAPGMTQEILHKSVGFLFHRIGGVIVNSADPLVITAFLGLSTLGKYQNYLYIMNSVLGVMNLIYTSWSAGLGNTIAHEGADTAYRSFEHSTFLTFCISTVCCCCFLNLYQPFISLWAGTDMLLDNGLVVCICVYFYMLRLMSTGNMFENIGGIWMQDKYRPLLEGLFNLVLNLILVQFIDLYGVLISTILSMALLSIPWLYHNVVGNLFQKSTVRYLKTLLLYTASTVAICAVTHFICRMVPFSNLFLVLLTRGSISVAVPALSLYLLYHKCEGWKWIMHHVLCTIHMRES